MLKYLFAILQCQYRRSQCNHRVGELYIYIYIYVVSSISFQTYFVQAFKIVVDTWMFSILLLYILWDDWSFMISGSNQQLQQQLEYTLLKPDCHRWWISKMQSDTLEERYTIKFCLENLEKCHRNWWNALDCFSTILHESSISFEWHKRFKEGEESVKDDERCGRSKEVNTKVLRLGLLCCDLKGVKEDILSEEASTHQIGSVAFPPGKCTSPQFHPCHRLFDQDGHQDSSSPSL